MAWISSTKTERGGTETIHEKTKEENSPPPRETPAKGRQPSKGYKRSQKNHNNGSPRRVRDNRGGVRASAKLIVASKWTLNTEQPEHPLLERKKANYSTEGNKKGKNELLHTGAPWSFRTRNVLWSRKGKMAQTHHNRLKVSVGGGSGMDGKSDSTSDL